MDPYLAAAIQMNSQPDFQHNLDQAYELIRKAANKNARFIGLPENFAFLGDLKARLDEADEIAKAAPLFLKNTAGEFDIFLLGGSFPVPDGEGKVYNRSLLIDPNGKILAKYDKIHLFDVDLSEAESYRESDFVHPGKKDPVVYISKEIGNIGLTVCYDLRFPELYRKLIDNEAEILTIPSAFTATTGKDHWEPLLRARAIENTAYVFAPAQTGIHGEKRKTHGHSLIIDPWGNILADAGTEVGMAIAEINTEKLEQARRRIPSLKHRVI